MSNLEENARLSHELEEARDTIESLVAEKAGITKQRDEMKRQLTIALEQNCKVRNELQQLKDGWSEFSIDAVGLLKSGDPASLLGIAPDLGDDSQTKEDDE